VELQSSPDEDKKPRDVAGVQVLDRAMRLLEHLADAGGSMRLAELEAVAGLPLPTIHRLLRSLASNGYVQQEPSKRYALGPRLMRLGETAGRVWGGWATPRLAELVTQFGETANMAILEGDSVVYVAQAPSPHSMRMFTEVGRRLPAHSTGVGKALLSQLRDEQVLGLLARTGMPVQTPHTLTDPRTLLDQLSQVRTRGWAVDDAEQELGVRCVAAPIPTRSTRAALSVSGPSGRLTSGRADQIGPVLVRTAQQLAVELPR